MWRSKPRRTHGFPRSNWLVWIQSVILWRKSISSFNDLILRLDGDFCLSFASPTPHGYFISVICEWEDITDSQRPFGTFHVLVLEHHNRTRRNFACAPEVMGAVMTAVSKVPYSYFAMTSSSMTDIWHSQDVEVLCIVELVLLSSILSVGGLRDLVEARFSDAFLDFAFNFSCVATRCDMLRFWSISAFAREHLSTSFLANPVTGTV